MDLPVIIYVQSFMYIKLHPLYCERAEENQSTGSVRGNSLILFLRFPVYTNLLVVSNSGLRLNRASAI